MAKKRNTYKLDRMQPQYSRILGILKLKFLLMGALAGLAVAGLAAAIVTSMNKSHVVHNTAAYHPATYAVAEKFMCGCPDCTRELIDCDCNHTEGGSYELYYISQQLKTGLSEQQAIAATQASFGRIKPEFRHLAAQSAGGTQGAASESQKERR